MRSLVRPLLLPLATPLHEQFGEGSTPPPPPAFSPSLDFSDARNSQYLALLFEDF